MKVVFFRRANHDLPSLPTLASTQPPRRRIGRASPSARARHPRTFRSPAKRDRTRIPLCDHAPPCCFWPLPASLRVRPPPLRHPPPPPRAQRSGDRAPACSAPPRVNPLEGPPSSSSGIPPAFSQGSTLIVPPTPVLYQWGEGLLRAPVLRDPHTQRYNLGQLQRSNHSNRRAGGCGALRPWGYGQEGVWAAGCAPALRIRGGGEELDGELRLRLEKSRPEPYTPTSDSARTPAP